MHPRSWLDADLIKVAIRSNRDQNATLIKLLNRTSKRQIRHYSDAGTIGDRSVPPRRRLLTLRDARDVSVMPAMSP
jgi:hypothetical protein